MRQKLLTLILFWVSWCQGWLCMPDTETLSRSVEAVRKYGWPNMALELMATGVTLRPETYTDEQATQFVTNGLLHLERGMRGPAAFNKLGSGNHMSRSFVFGTDDFPGSELKPRWRWLPLIDSYDSHHRPIYHHSTWTDGSSMKSLDLLRVDYYFSKHMRFLVPPAIVRPVQVDTGFGRGLQFTTLYEFAASIPRYKRQPTLASAAELKEAILQGSNRWLALVSRNSRQSVDLYYQLLTPKWIHENLGPLPKKRRTKSQLNQLDRASLGSDESETELASTQHHGAPPILDNLDASQISWPMSLEALFSKWKERASVYPHGSRSLSGQSSALSTLTDAHTEVQRHRDASDSAPSRILQLNDRLHLYAPVPMRVTADPLHNIGARRALGTPRAVDLPGKEGESLSISSDPGRSGFTRWRRPAQTPSDQPDSP